ncbi:DUF6538 domain-containing protein [Sphingomonas sp. NPDC079357]|uniref:DUF6538 domain-containing protein n=1 Tax=Sphingomonas sp. NPDC079357 TaxID=3364518 RepID=UPI00384B6F1B
MAKTKGLWQDPRSGIYYLRRKIPEALRPSFACGDFYKVSLGTGDLRDAEKRFAVANGEYERKLATFREALTRGGEGRLTPEQASALVTRHLTSRSPAGFASGGTQVAFILFELDKAVADLAGAHLPTAQSMSAEDWAAYRRRMAGSDTDDELSDEALARIQADHDARHAPPGEAWFAFQKRVPRRRWRPLLTEPVAALKRQLGLTEGDVPGIDEPLADALAEALRSPEMRQQLPQAPSVRRRNQTTRARPDMKLAALAGRWQAARSPTPKAIAAAAKAIEYFISYIGDVGIGEITADDCFEYRDALEVMPASMPRAQRRLPFADLVTLYESRTDVVRVKPASVKKYLGAIQALLGFAFQERFIPANVAAGIKVEGHSKKSNRRPFTRAELTSLFADPLFTRAWSLSESRSSVSDTTLRWLFFLGLCTGGRIEELGQILVPDVQQADGVWYIDVTTYISEDVAEADPELAKRTKTDSSTRVIPLHPKLIELGFVNHVLALYQAGFVKLFGDLRPDSLQVQTKEASRRANRVIDKAVSRDRRIVFHSFRHTFKDLCRDAEIPKDVHDQMMGHAPADVGGGYGLGRAVASLAAHMKTIDLDFIDWSAILAASKV